MAPAGIACSARHTVDWNAEPVSTTGVSKRVRVPSKYSASSRAICARTGCSPGSTRAFRRRCSTSSARSRPRRSTKSSRCRPRSSASASIEPSGVSSHLACSTVTSRGARRRGADDAGEGFAESAAGFEALVQLRVDHGLSFPDVGERQAHAPRAVIGLECHAAIALELAARGRWVDAQFRELRVAVAPQRLAFHGDQQPARPARAACGRGRADGISCTADSRRAAPRTGAPKNSTFSRFGVRARQVGRQKMPVVRTPSQKTPSYVGSWRRQRAVHRRGCGEIRHEADSSPSETDRRRNSGRQFGSPSYSLASSASVAYAHPARAFHRVDGPRERGHRNLEADRQVARQRPQQAEEIEAAFAGHEALGARLEQQALGVGRPRRRRVAQLHVAKPFARRAFDLGRRAAAAIEMDGVDQEAGVGAARRHAGCARLARSRARRSTASVRGTARCRTVRRGRTVRRSARSAGLRRDRCRRPARCARRAERRFRAPAGSRPRACSGLRRRISMSRTAMPVSSSRASTSRITGVSPTVS